MADAPEPAEVTVAIIQCVRCGKVIPHTEAFYSPQGQVCSVCHGVDEVKEGWRNPIVRASFLGLAAGLLALASNPFFALSIVALLGGSATLFLHRNPSEATRFWLDDRKVFLVMGVGAVLLGLGTLAWDLLRALL